MSPIRSTLAALLVLALAAAPAAAGPWARGAGHWYAQVSFATLDTEKLATPAGDEVEIPHFSRDELVLYGEAGLSDRLTAIASFPLHVRSALRAFADESGVGDLRLGLAAECLRRGRLALALRGTVQAPTGDETLGGGLLPSGSGVWEGEAAVSVGVAGGPGYAQAEVGHQFRGGGLRDGLVYGCEAGWNLHPRLTLAFFVQGLEPWRGGPQDEPASSPAGLGDGVTYVTYGPAAAVKIGSGLALDLRAERDARARNLAPGTSWRFGLSWQR